LNSTSSATTYKRKYGMTSEYVIPTQQTTGSTKSDSLSPINLKNVFGHKGALINNYASLLDLFFVVNAAYSLPSSCFNVWPPKSRTADVNANADPAEIAVEMLLPTV
jgi:hypothetical protein